MQNHSKIIDPSAILIGKKGGRSCAGIPNGSGREQSILPAAGSQGPAGYRNVIWPGGGSGAPFYEPFQNGPAAGRADGHPGRHLGALGPAGGISQRGHGAGNPLPPELQLAGQAPAAEDWQRSGVPKCVGIAAHHRNLFRMINKGE